jgi:hypothetical protein
MGISGIQKGVEAAETMVNPTDELPEPTVGSELPEPTVGSELPEPTVGSELPEPTVGSELPEQVASTDEELAEQVAPIVVNTETAEPVVTPEVTEQVVTPEVTEQVIAPVVTPEVAVEEIAPADEQNSKLNDAVKTIVTEITKQVEENLTARAAQQDGEDDGFKAFTGAVDKLSNDTPATELEPKTGGKRRNTRRFKLVKNKTKRSAV